LTVDLGHSAHLQKIPVTVREQITYKQLTTFDNVVRSLDTIAGIDRQIAILIVVQVGVEMTRFPSAEHLTSWAGPNNKQWRVIGALNALSGRVDYLDAYIIGRAKLIVFYRQVVAAYPRARRIYVVQDNWSIHTHEEVQAALATLPAIEPVWLPTYAPWLNPIEKLWRLKREQVLTMHRLAGDWSALRERVNAFLDQFAEAADDLLHYVGLRGEGKLAQALCDP